MNISTLMGIIAAVFVIYSGVIKHSTNSLIFLDSHALILVVGGTLSAALIAFPIKDIIQIMRFIFLGVLYPKSRNKLKVAYDILLFKLNSNLDTPVNTNELSHPFLAEGFLLIRKNKFNSEEFRTILAERNLHFKESYLNDAKILNSLAKFPPAFGLLGATTGMISMMSNLGDGGKDSIGPSMAIALVATFWGIAVANLILLPLADHASKLSRDDTKMREMMMTGLIMLHEGAEVDFLFEVLRGYLPLKDRSDPYFKHLKAKILELNIGNQHTQDVNVQHISHARRSG